MQICLYGVSFGFSWGPIGAYADLSYCLFEPFSDFQMSYTESKYQPPLQGQWSRLPWHAGWLVPSEIHDLNTRSAGQSITVFTQLISGAVVTQVRPC